jgi:SET domain-containing protein
MALLEKQLVVKRSTIPGSGKGLFTKKFIPKGTLIVEYKGRISTWKEADINEGLNGYLFRVKASHTINAEPWTKALARYANDATGFKKIKGLRNNSIYVIDGLKVYIESTRDIEPGEEILVAYGKEYWTVMKKNIRKAEKEAKEKMK